MHYFPHRKAHKFLITHDLIQKGFQQPHPAVQHHYRFISFLGIATVVKHGENVQNKVDKTTFSAVTQAIQAR